MYWEFLNYERNLKSHSDLAHSPAIKSPTDWHVRRMTLWEVTSPPWQTTLSTISPSPFENDCIRSHYRHCNLAKASGADAGLLFYLQQNRDSWGQDLLYFQHIDAFLIYSGVQKSSESAAALHSFFNLIQMISC